MNKKISSLSEKLDPRSKDGPSRMNKSVNSEIISKRERDNDDGKAGPSSEKTNVDYSPKDIEIPDGFLLEEFNYDEENVIKKKAKLKDFVINNPKDTEFPDDDSLFDNLDIVDEINVEKKEANLTKCVVDDPKDIEIPDDIDFDDFNYEEKKDENKDKENDKKKANSTKIVISDPKNQKDDKKKENLTKNVMYDLKDIEIPDDIEFDDFEFEQKDENKNEKKNSACKNKKTAKKNPDSPSTSTNCDKYFNENKSVQKISKQSSKFSVSNSESSCSISKQFMSKISIIKSEDSGIENEMINEQDFNDLFGDWNEENKYYLNLEDFNRVRVLKIEETRSSTRLTVEDPETQLNAVVTCSEAWYRLKVSTGDFVTIKAIKSKDKSDWTINNDHGFCVTQPDTLVTSTAVVNSFFCNRQGVLQSKLIGLNQLPNLQASDSSLTLGTIIHELLQSALTENIFELKDITNRFDEILKNPSTILMLYCSELKQKDIKSMAEEYILAIHEFMYRYVKDEKLKTKDDLKTNEDNFKGKIIEIKDIEESVYLPSLGLKGKIDATVTVKINDNKKIMPLEIKTGKSSFYQTHKGQLYSYCLMLNILGTKVDGGLLLYIKDNLMQEFKANRQEEKELILLRNTVAYYLSKLPENNSKKNKNKIQTMELPDPIYHTTACAKCPYNSVCCVYAEREPDLPLSKNHPLKKLSNILLQDVTENHIDYVLTWIAMLEIEEGHNRDIALSRRIWGTTPINREKKRQCISNLKVTDVKKEDNSVVHHFVRSDSQIKFPVDNFREVFNQYDVVSIGTDTRIHLSGGQIIKIDNAEMIIVLDKDLTKWNYTGIFHVDYYPYINRTNRLLGTVATLFTENPITKKLRRIIIDKQPATFSSNLPDNFYTNEIKRICCSLNLLQDNAVKAVIQADDYVLIKSMPGTGKIYLIVALVEILVLMGKTILITAHSHNSINNIMLKLIEKKIDFLRIGRTSRIHSLLLEKCDDELIKNCHTPEMLESKLREIKVVGVTCYSAGSGLLSRKIFDYCIVDECNQILQPVILKPLFNAEKIVLVGDPEQLSPAVQSPKARKLGISQDIFSRLDSPNNTRVLSLQYRMNFPIMNLANQLTYNDELRAADGTIGKSTYKFEDKSVIEQSEDWIKKILSNELNEAVVMVNTGPTYREVLDKFIKNKKDDPSVEDNARGKGSNIFEALIVAKLVETLVKSGVKFEDIGIISPFRSQINLLKRVIDKSCIEIDTVEQYQGKNKSIILLSFGKSVKPDSGGKINDNEILEDHRRLNVALTRANHKLIVIGDVGSIQRFTPVKKMINCLALKKKIVKLTDGIDDFSWTKLLADVEKYLNN